MFIGVALVVALAGACGAERWRWPEDADAAASVRIDTKVRFVDDGASNRYRQNKVQADEIKEPADTDGFYNRPAGAGSGRYPVRAEPERLRDTTYTRYLPSLHDKVQADEIKEPADTDGFYNRPAGAGSGRYPVRAEPVRLRDTTYTRYQQSDGTLDSLQYCKCVSTPECSPRTDLPNACGSGMFLCCYKRPSKNNHNSEYFNEIDDERPMLLPNYEKRGGAFPDAPGVQLGADASRLLAARPLLAGPDGPTGHIGPSQRNPGLLVGPEGPTGHVGPDPARKLAAHQRGTLVGPDGPTGNIGPPQRNHGLLVGPEGPTGHIGPDHRDDRAHGGRDDHRNQGVLVGPDGPTGHIGPAHSTNTGVLVGPDGPTGQIGPAESAQRGVLVGPGGPTGYLGPQQYGQRPVLVGPGGATGLIGPGGRGGRRQGVLAGPGGPTGMIGPYGFQGGRVAQPGLLVGPGGPTGIIGPGRRLLVGPGGPTGQIGPRGYGQFGF